MSDEEELKDAATPEAEVEDDGIYDADGVVSARFLAHIGAAIADRDTLTLSRDIGDLHQSELGDLLEALQPEQRRALVRLMGDDFDFMVDANHCYTTPDAFYVGRALEELGAYWFEEPVAPEDHDGYRELRAGLSVNISGGEAEFNRWGWRQILENRGLDIAQPEVCALGGISEYLRVLALCHAHFTPVVNHVWGSAIAVATNLHLLAAMPPLPGGLNPREPMLEFDTTDNRFRDALLTEPLQIARQVAANAGRVAVPQGPGLGVVPDRAFLAHHAIDA